MIVLIIVILIFFLFLSFFFAGIETGFVSLDVLKLEREANSDKKLKGLLRLIKQPDNYLGTTLIGNNIALVVFSSLFTTYFVENYGVFNEKIGSLFITTVILIFGEIIPKSLFRNYSFHLVTVSFPFFRFFYYLFTPLRFFITGINHLIKKAVQKKGDDEKTKYTVKDLNYLFSQTKGDSNLMPEQRKMIEETLEFSELEAKNVMTPRTDVTFFEQSSDVKEILRIIKNEGYSRYPIYKDKIDNIVGILIVQDFINKDLDKKVDLKTMIRPAQFVPETLDISSVLLKMKKEKVSLSIVIDPYGGFSGIITIEDILEEIVGEIEDEYDIDTDSNGIKKIAEKTYLINGDIEIDTLIDRNIFLPEGDYETIAGLLIEKLAEIPNKGKVIKFDNYKLEVMAADNRRIEQVKLTIKK